MKDGLEIGRWPKKWKTTLKNGRQPQKVETIWKSEKVGKSEKSWK